MRLSRTTLIVVTLLLATNAPAFAQEEDPKVRLYAQRIHAYLNRGPQTVSSKKVKPSEAIRNQIAEKAKEFELSAEKQKKLEEAVTQTLGKFARELATSWLKDNSSQQRSADGKSLQSSTLLFETSAAWNMALAKVLDKDTLTKWNIDRDKRLKGAKEERDAEIEAAQKRIAEQERQRRQREAQLAMAQQQMIFQQVQVLVGAGNLQQAVPMLRQQLTYRVKALAALLEKEVERLEGQFQLDEKKKRRLVVAIKGVVRKDLDRAISVVEEAEMAGGNLSEELEKKIMDLVHGGSAPEESKFWRAALKSTLGKEKYDKYVLERSNAKEFERDAWARMTVLLFHRAASLTKDQREQMVTRLKAAKLPSIVLSAPPYHSGATYNSIPQKIRREAIADILTAEQIDSVRSGQNGNVIINGGGGGGLF